MGQFYELFDIVMEVSVYKFASVGAYFACGCATSYDTSIFNVSGWKGVREFYQEGKEI